MSDLLERAKQMPSSLNDACRTIELMGAEIGRLQGDYSHLEECNRMNMAEIERLREQLAKARAANARTER